MIPREFLAACGRYAVVWLLGWLVLKGVITQEQAEQFSGPLTEWVIGVGGSATMIVWLYFRKKRNDRLAAETADRIQALAAMSREPRGRE